MWRWTAARVGFLGLDAWALLPMLAWALHWRWWTFQLAVAGVAFFAVLQFFGMSIPACLRWARAAVAGPDRSGTPANERSFYA